MPDRNLYARRTVTEVLLQGITGFDHLFVRLLLVFSPTDAQSSAHGVAIRIVLDGPMRPSPSRSLETTHRPVGFFNRAFAVAVNDDQAPTVLSVYLSTSVDNYVDYLSTWHIRRPIGSRSAEPGYVRRDLGGAQA